MKNSFAFQRFVIDHDRCAMKVGTDGVLLGAWADVSQSDCILDIGCGSGLIALMAAQRAPESRVWGIDVDKPSLLQAQENVAKSPFSSQVKLLHQDVCTYFPAFRFGCILCNPPFYTEDTLPPDMARMRARHTAGLTLECLLQQVERLLLADGRFGLILPLSCYDGFMAYSLARSWFASRICMVRTVQHKEPKRVLLELSRKVCPETQFCELTLQGKDGKRTEAYSKLCSEFYLPR